MIIVSKATQRHCAGTVHSQGGRVGNVKQVGFEPGLEDSYGRCGSDKIRQTVPDATRKARSPTVDSRVRLTSAVTFTFVQTFDRNFVFFAERCHVDRQCEA